MRGKKGGIVGFFFETELYAAQWSYLHFYHQCPQKKKEPYHDPRNFSLVLLVTPSPLPKATTILISIPTC